jgi:hypothetical protein
MHSFHKMIFAMSITVLTSLSSAQSTGTQTPDTVGVEPAEAREAMERARQREADATVVRTDNTAAQQAREAAGNNNLAPGSTLGVDRPLGTRAGRADRN